MGGKGIKQNLEREKGKPATGKKKGVTPTHQGKRAASYFRRQSGRGTGAPEMGLPKRVQARKSLTRQV